MDLTDHYRNLEMWDEMEVENWDAGYLQIRCIPGGCMYEYYFGHKVTAAVFVPED